MHDIVILTSHTFEPLGPEPLILEYNVTVFLNPVMSSQGAMGAIFLLFVQVGRMPTS